MLQIKIEEPLNDGVKPLYLDNKIRYPNITDIKFINNKYLVIAHRYARKLYLIKLINNKYQIISSLLINYENIYHKTESFDIINNTIYLLGFSEFLIIVDIINYKKLKINKVIKIDTKNITYHGIKYFDNSIYLTPSTYSSDDNNNIIKFNIKNDNYQLMETGDILKNYRIKDIIFITNNLVILSIVIKTTTTLFDNTHNSDSIIGLFSFPDYKLMDKVEYNNIHLDLGCSKDNNYYICGHDLEGGFIYKGTIDIDNNKIININKIKVEDFPHGICIYDNFLAYTSYGTSSAYIHDLSEFL